MLIAHVIGGLGNQMFQYAFIRALAASRRAGFCLDVRDFRHYRRHQGYELPRVFGLSPPLSTEAELDWLLGWRGLKPLRKLIERPALGRVRGAHYVLEPHFQFWEGASAVPDDCYLKGHWQSERYFLSIEEDIRRAFTFRPPLEGRNLELAGLIARSPGAVSLHVRRGDYVSNAEAARFHGLCSPDYYHQAIARLREQSPELTFFVFSDDIAWVREHVRIPEPARYVDWNSGPESFNDMRLMSLCRHHVIANSSFSWWGAWLNPRRDKRVFAPRRWFLRGLDTRDLIPASWERL